MRINEMFPKGTRVESTQKAIDNGVFRGKKYGTVVGYGREFVGIHVLIDGHKEKHNYDISFWRKIEGL